jgi:hypothetical protein
MASKLAAAGQMTSSSNLAESLRRSLRNGHPAKDFHFVSAPRLCGARALEVAFPAAHPRAPQPERRPGFISAPLFLKKTGIFLAHPPGFAFYLLLFSPSTSPDFPPRPLFHAIIKL